MNRIAMILSAGLGTRLRPLTDQLPKPLVPVGLEPSIQNALSLARGWQADRIVINTHAFADMIEQAVRRLVNGQDALFFSREPDLLGTAGGIAHALQRIVTPESLTLILNSDMRFNPDIDKLVYTHQSKSAWATMVLRENPDPTAYTSVEIDQGQNVHRFLRETKTAKSLMYTGVCMLSPMAIATLPSKGCLVRNGFIPWLEQGKIIPSHIEPVTTPWTDIGTTQDYFDAHMQLAPLVHPTATISPKACVSECVIGENSVVIGSIKLQKCIVWPNTTVDKDHHRAILTPNGCVQL